MSEAPASPVTPAVPISAGTVRHFRDLIREGRIQDACAESRAHGPLEQWEPGDARNVAARLLSVLGAPRLSAALHLRNWRTYPEDDLFYLYHSFHYVGRFGPLATLNRFTGRLREREADLSPDLAADCWAFHGYLLGIFRDFGRSADSFARAEACSPERPWVWTEKAEVLKMEDRYEEALETARQALAMRPHYRPATEITANLLYLANRDDEAIDLLERGHAAKPVNRFLALLSSFYSEREDLEKTLWCFDEYERLSPFAEKATREWLAARRCDVHRLRRDVARAIEFGKQTESKFHEKLIGALEKSGAEAPGDRVRLDVPFIRQHNMTCAPATLTAIATYFGKEADHLDLAEDICYDGTAGHSQRNWAGENGWLTREFDVTWEISRELIDRGIPFTLTTVETTSAHLQAVIGYDPLGGLLLVRDPTHKHFQEFIAEGFLEEHAFSGPRGFVLVPPESAARLEGLDLPNAELYDLLHEVNSALEIHNREGAAQHLRELRKIAPEHRITLTAERAVAGYDDDPHRIHGALEKLSEAYPDVSHLHYAKLMVREAFSTREEQLAFIKEQLDHKLPDSVFYRTYAQRLADDARRHDEALYYYRRTLVRRPTDAATLCDFAGLLWSRQNFEESAGIYRLAACLEDKWEYLSRSYFLACRHVGRTTEALAFLRERFEAFGDKSSAPAVTLFDACERLDRTDEALAVLEDALRRRPEDGDLMLFASDRYFAHGMFEESARLLEQAKSRSAPASWARKAAWQASGRGDASRAMELWKGVLEIDPLAQDGNGEMARLLAETEHLSSALDYLAAQRERFPKNIPIHELSVHWLQNDAPGAAEPVLRHLIDLNPSNAWALRELALELEKLTRYDEAQDLAEQALAVAPDESSSHCVLGSALVAKGAYGEAASHLKKALELRIDNGAALDLLLDCAQNYEERRRFLTFVEERLVNGVTFGDGIGSYQRYACRIMDAEEVLEALRHLHEARPELWQSWSYLAEQLLHMDRGEEALEIARGLVERHPLMPRAWLDLADVYAQQANYDQQAGALTRALEINPAWTMASRRLAEAEERRGNMERAREILVRTTQVDPLTPQNHGCLADLLWKSGEREAALDAVQRAVEADPGYEWGWEKLGEWAAILDQPDRSVKLAEQLTERRPKDPGAWLILAQQHDQGREVEQCLKAVDQGLAVNPRSADLRDFKAWRLARDHRFEEAVATCREAAEYGTGIPRTLLGRLAWIEWARNHRDEAIRLMQEVTLAHPDYYWAHRELADWLFELERWEDAAELSGRLVQIAGASDPIPHGYLAHARLNLGDEEGALPHLRRAFDLDPEYDYAGDKLFDIQMELKEYDEARETVAIFKRSSGPEQGWLREVRLHTAREDPEAARTSFDRMCRISSEDESVIAEAMACLEEKGYAQGQGTALQACLTRGEAANSGVSEAWVKAVLEQGWKPDKVRATLADMPLEGKLHDTGWRQLVYQLAENGKHRQAIRIIEAEPGRFRTSTMLWGAAGWVYHDAHRAADCCEWLGDWREREDAEPWMLINLSVAMKKRGPLETAHDVHVHAVRDLAPDSSTNTHRACLAFSHAQREEWDEARAQLDWLAPEDLSGFDRFVSGLTSTLVRIRENASPGEIGETFSGALEGYSDWHSDQVDQKYLREVCARLLRTTFPHAAFWRALLVRARC